MPISPRHTLWDSNIVTFSQFAMATDRMVEKSAASSSTGCHSTL